MSEDKPEKWELPEPVFRSSTGEPVKPSERIEFDPEPDTLEPGYADPETGEDVQEAGEGIPAGDIDLANLYAPVGSSEPDPGVTAAPASAVEIEPQPQISEQFKHEDLEIETDVPEPSSGGVLRTVLFTLLFLILLGVIGVAGIAAYFYFAGRSSSGQF